MNKLTLREARELQAKHTGSKVIVEPNHPWLKSRDNRFDPDHPRHHELCICIPIYIVVDVNGNEIASSN